MSDSNQQPQEQQIPSPGGNPFSRQARQARARAEVDAALALRGPFKLPGEPSDAGLSEEEAWESFGQVDGGEDLAGAPLADAQGERFEDGGDDDGRDGVIVLSGENLRPEPVRWLWPGWLALGKLHILAGAPGQGKTTIALALAATITRAGTWPDGTHSQGANILVWSGEDDPADTLLPRLLAAGAEPSRCKFVGGTRVNGRPEPFDPARDLPALAQRARAIGNVRLLIVDPVVSAVAGDSHKNTEVRRALQPLVDLAHALDAAVLGISHFSKGGAGGDPAARVTGSIAFSAVARIVLAASKVAGVMQDASGANVPRRILVRAKSNIGPDDGGFEYHIDQLMAMPGIEASCIIWGQPVSGTARELLAEPEGDSGDGEGSSLEAACQLLRRELAVSQTPANTVREAAAEAGIPWGAVRRAAQELAVIKTKSGLNAGQWFWKLPERERRGGPGDDQGAEGAGV